MSLFWILIFVVHVLGMSEAFQVPLETLHSLRKSRQVPSLTLPPLPATRSPETPSSETTSQQRSFESFDYNSCWYPVVWSEDVPMGKPTKVTLFDVNYVVAKTSNGEVMALVDRCPHKAAALSEGRFTSAGYFQCAYHGWSFDGKDGACVEIPQVVAASPAGTTPPDPSLSRRACATAVPAIISQGMVWMFPGGTLEAAVLASPPPTIPEWDQPGFRTTTVVRDFPVDWSILVENILDPDHGAFAHGALGFDLYSASTDVPQMTDEEFTNDGKGWRITSRVDAVEKVLRFDKLRRGRKVKATEADRNKIKTGTATFTAPSQVVMGRRHKETEESSFLIGFWVCPVGTGRSRFMSANIAKAPFGIPRWINHVVINNFLDQDTYLLATQQRPVLLAEAMAVENMLESGAQPKSLNVRKNTYAYRSPAEKLQTRLGAFWDETLSRAPNRVPTLLSLKQSNALQILPSREVVLDREGQHLRICPDSQQTVENCRRIQRVSLVASLVVAGVKLWTSLFREFISGPVLDRLGSILKPKTVTIMLVGSAITHWLATKLRREFYFKYTEQLRDRDLTNIPKVWLDKQ